jgi:hypothetical protein
MMERVKELLRGNYWIIDASKNELTKPELNFLSYFFHIHYDIFFDEISNEEKIFLILKKKDKFIYH